MKKKFVSVKAHFSECGKVSPFALIWEDGRVFEIDRILDVRKAASLKVGGIGLRYLVVIDGNERYMYKDEDMWFVEARD